MNWPYENHFYFLCARGVYKKDAIVKSWIVAFNTTELLPLLCNTSICLQRIVREWQNKMQLLDSRSSLPEVFCKKSILRNFTKFTGKHLYQSLFFNKVAGQPANSLKKRLWHRCFPVKFVKFLRTPFLQNSSGRLFLVFISFS